MGTVSREHGQEHVGWRQFIALDDADKRELVDGRLVEVDVPTVLHEWIVSRLIFFLSTWAEERSAGIVLGSGYKVRIRDDRGVMPDVQFFRAGRRIPGDGLAEGAPDLVVEVISPTSARYDRVEKLNWYASIGAPEYWLIDGEQRTLQRFVLEPSGFYRLDATSAGEATFSPDTFPGIAIRLSGLWALPPGY